KSRWLFSIWFMQATSDASLRGRRRPEEEGETEETGRPNPLIHSERRTCPPEKGNFSAFVAFLRETYGRIQGMFTLMRYKPVRAHKHRVEPAPSRQPT